jgi:hypothetical protein
MSPVRITMMSEEDIESEFGWNDKMIHCLLQNPDSPHGRASSPTWTAGPRAKVFKDREDEGVTVRTAEHPLSS